MGKIIWTPGPWIIVRQDRDEGDIWYDIWSQKENQSVAHVAEMAREGKHLGRTRNDARFIAACPDIWTALMDLRNYSNDGGCWCDAFDKGINIHTIPCQKARAITAPFWKE